MNIMIVDDERLLMEDTAAMCREIPSVGEVNGFVSAADALGWLEKHSADVALLDIDMPGMNGLQLAEKIKTISPDTKIVFVTGYSDYAVDAFKIKASGYLLKPVTKEDLAREITYAAPAKPPEKSEGVVIRTFGAFEVFKDGKPIKFKIAKCKELLAYLVDRQGGSATRAELSAVLWEDRMYDRKQQKQLDVYIRALKDTLAAYDMTEIFEMQSGSLRIVPETFTCDAYRFFAGDAGAVNAYRGEYMGAYSWASITEGLLSQNYNAAKK